MSVALDAFMEFFVNRNYRASGRLHPWHGFTLFGAVIALTVMVEGVIWQVFGDRVEAGDASGFILYSQIALLLLAVTFIVSTGMKWADLKLHGLRVFEVGLAIVLSVVAFLGAMAIVIPVALIHQLMAPEFYEWTMEQMEFLNEVILPSSGIEFLMMLILVAFLPAVIEELLYRGLIMEAFMRWGPVWAVLLSGAAFGISHGMLLRIPSLIFVGILLGWLKYRTGSLSASILMHLIYNAMVITLGFALNKVIETPVACIYYSMLYGST